MNNMKKIILLFSIILAIVGGSALKNKQIQDVSVNQIGAAAIYHGVTSESGTWSDIGGAICSAGGGALVNAGGLATGAAWAIGSNPVGWAIGGAALVL